MAEQKASGQRRLTRDDWITAALGAIADGGLAAVGVEPLAARLGATKGSFYWHFENRDALIEAAIGCWEKETTTDVVAEITAARDAPASQSVEPPDADRVMNSMSPIGRTSSTTCAALAAVDARIMMPAFAYVFVF